MALRKQMIIHDNISFFMSLPESLKFRFCVQHRSSCSRMFFKTGVLRNSANFTRKHLCRSLFLIKLQTEA